MLWGLTVLGLPVARNKCLESVFLSVCRVHGHMCICVNARARLLEMILFGCLCRDLWCKSDSSHCLKVSAAVCLLFQRLWPASKHNESPTIVTTEQHSIPCNSTNVALMGCRPPKISVIVQAVHQLSDSHLIVSCSKETRRRCSP